jgi:1-acyl-sn-glycerol-3-phosphate acyltransferase
MFRWLCRQCLRLMGWKSVGDFPVGLKKYVVIVAPHTSGWDFVIGVMFRSVLHMEKAHYLGKAELFKPPFGFLFRWLGGYPVDRSSRHNMVEQVVNIFQQHDEFVLALSPEGTRQRVDRLRTGFYNIARQAKVPIVMIGFDYQRKLVLIDKPFDVTNEEVDMKRILDFFRPVRGKFAEKDLGHL